MPQSLVSCSPDTRPASIGFLVDVSRSMRLHTNRVRETLDACLALFPGDYEHLLFVSADSFHRLEPPPQFAGTLADLLSGVVCKGRTAIVEHIRAAGIEMAKAKGPRRMLLVFSDGLDNLSESSADEIVRVLLRAQVTLFVVDLFGPDYLIPDSSRYGSFLGQLAERTGGLNLLVTNSRESNRAATAIAGVVRGSSLVSYYSSNPSLDGSYRQIKIELEQELGSPPLRLHYRQGYYAPNQ